MGQEITVTGMTVHKVRLAVRSERRQGTGAIKDAMINVYLRLATDAGIVGWGEAASAAAFPGTTEADMAALHVHLRPLLIGADPFRIEALMAKAERTVVHVPQAKAAMEAALYDIVGKALRTPVCNLLGGRVRDRIPLSFSIANPDLAADVEMAKRVWADGVRIFKVKTGFAGHGEDLRRLETLRRALPDAADLRVDYNQALACFDAIAKLRDVERFCPTFIEQPVALDRIDALAEIARALDTPIMADESVFTPAQALAVASERAVDAISIKTMKGGIMRARRIAAIAEAAGIPCYGGDMAESGLGHLAGVHAVAATPNISLGCEFYQATYYLKEDLLERPFPVEDGQVVVPTTPGLGIDVDEDKLARATVERLG